MPLHAVVRSGLLRLSRPPRCHQYPIRTEKQSKIKKKSPFYLENIFLNAIFFIKT